MLASVRLLQVAYIVLIVSVRRTVQLLHSGKYLISSHPVTASRILIHVTISEPEYDY